MIGTIWCGCRWLASWPFEAMGYILNRAGWFMWDIADLIACDYEDNYDEDAEPEE